MRYTFFSLLLTLVFLATASCSKKDSSVSPSEEELAKAKAPYKTGKDLSSSKENPIVQPWKKDPLFMLGYGYDITGKYAHPAFIRSKVIDVEKFYAENKNRIQFYRAASQGIGLSFSGDRDRVRTILGEQGGFSKGEITKYKNLFNSKLLDDFKSDTSFQHLPYHYRGVSEMITHYLVELHFSIHQADWFLENYISSTFLLDIATKPADEILKIYGTHVLSHIKVGERIDYTYRYADDKNSSSADWFIYNIGSYFNSRGNLLGSKPFIEAPLKENLAIEVIDGSKDFLPSWMIDITNYTKNPITFDGWKEITDAHLTLIDFWRHERLQIPIYELVKDESKRIALKAAFEKYMGAE